MGLKNREQKQPALHFRAVTRVTHQLLETVGSADFCYLVLLQPPVCCYHQLQGCSLWICGLIHAGTDFVQELTTCSLMCWWVGIKWNTQLRCRHAFGPAKRSACSVKQRWGLFILQFRCKLLLLSQAQEWQQLYEKLMSDIQHAHNLHNSQFQEVSQVTSCSSTIIWSVRKNTVFVFEPGCVVYYYVHQHMQKSLFNDL